MALMLILVDGYNVTKSDPATAALLSEAQRDQLVARLRARGAELLGAGRIVVVFDGVTGGGPAASAAPVEVHFSRDGESADDLIVSLAGNAHETEICLVTSDRELAQRVRSAASVPVTVVGKEAAFHSAKAKRRRRSPSRAVVSESLGVPPGGNDITRELEGIWCVDDEGKE
ncbi:MAG: NYN domain-containing protein [Coriobacteriia bacterium]|jgi:predicted RNA-binding protein with PIN domain|nr:NYN domain-containing protein [Coriobacteriia bacterium]